jgi:hypothetical protein
MAAKLKFYQLFCLQLLTEVFIRKAGSAALLNYNMLTSLFFVLSALCLFNGLRRKHNILLFVSGFVGGLSIFIRFPNLLILSVFVAIVFYGFICHKHFKKIMVKTFLFISGYVCSIVFMLLALKTAGQLELYVSSLTELLTQAKDPEFHHSAGGLLRLFVKEHFYALSLSIYALIGLGIISFLLDKLRRKVLRNFLIVLVCIGAACVLGVSYLWVWLYVGIMYLILLSYIFDIVRSNTEFRLLVMLSFLILVIAPLGSNNGMRNAVYGMWIALPVVFMTILQLRPFSISGVITGGRKFIIDIKAGFCNAIKQLVVLTIILLSLYLTFTYTCRDSSNRLAMRYSVAHPMLRGVYTTKERADVLQGLLIELSKHAKKGDCLFAFEGIPLVHFVTKTRPYLYCPWPIQYPPQVLKAKLTRAIRERPYLPLFTRAKASTSKFEWPNDVDELRDGGRPYSENRKIVHQFLSDYDYYKEWENSFFEIWIPTNPMPQAGGM